nr:AraC family transcriptional regulator [Falsiroseomonas tokyonensis]
MLRRPAAPAAKRRTGRLAPWQESRVIAHIEANLQEPIRVEHLAALVRLSASYFARAFKASFGDTPHEYLLRLRVQHAQLQLLHSDVPLAQIALDCGMCDQAHLSRVFRRATGTSPSAWRRHHSRPD